MLPHMEHCELPGGLPLLTLSLLLLPNLPADLLAYLLGELVDQRVQVFFQLAF